MINEFEQLLHRKPLEPAAVPVPLTPTIPTPPASAPPVARKVELMNPILTEIIAFAVTYLETHPITLGPFTFEVSSHKVTVGPITITVA